MKASFTPEAKADLKGIWLYTAENWGEDQTETYSRNLSSIIDRALPLYRSTRFRF
jgi:plasmid stabilization system protein ParE